MLLTRGSIQTVMNDDLIEDKSWDLRSLDDEEIEGIIKLNDQTYEIRDFTSDDLGFLLTHPHNTDALYTDIDAFKINRGPTSVMPYPKYSYRRTPVKRRGKALVMKTNSVKSSSIKKRRRSSSLKKKMKMKHNADNKCDNKCANKSKVPVKKSSTRKRKLRSSSVRYKHPSPIS